MGLCGVDAIALLGGQGLARIPGALGLPDASIDLRPCSCRLLTDLDQALD